MIHPALPESETAPPAPTAQRSLSSSRNVRTNLDANCPGTPNSEQLTAYDKAHLVIYLRLLDADAARADWQTTARLVLSLDPTADFRSRTAGVRRALARARWMTRVDLS